MSAYRHTNGDDGDGCVPCYFEAVEAIVNGAEPVPGCREPADDGEGYCAICGHQVEPVGSPHTPLQGG